MMTYEYLYSFNELLKQFIKEAEITNKEFAEKRLKMDRGTFLQILRGSRHCPERLLHQILTELKLPDEKKQLLIDAYDSQEYKHQWPVVRENRKQITECLKTLHFLDSHNDEFENIISMEFKAIHIKESSFSDREIRYVLSAILEKEFSSHEIPEIRAFVPSDLSEFFDSMKYLYLRDKGKTIHFRQIIPVGNSSEQNRYDVRNLLQYLSVTLFFLYSGCPGYIPYQTKTDISLENIESIPFPFYIITSDSVVHLSGDLSEGYISSRPEDVETFRKRFDRMVRKMESSVKHYPTFEAFMQMIRRIQEKASIISLEISSAPCFLTLLPQEFVFSKIRQEYFEQTPGGPDVMESIGNILSYQEQLKNVRFDLDVAAGEFFYESGLAQFVEDGIIRVYPEGLVQQPLSLEERRMVLNYLKEDIENPEESVNPHYMIRNGVDTELSEIVLSFFDNELIIYRNFLRDFLTIKIQNRELMNAFKEYFTVYMVRRSMIYSRTEAVEVIEGYIAKIEKRIAEQKKAEELQ